MEGVEQAWTTEQVQRITGVSRRRLSYWIDKGIVGPDVDEARGRGRVRLWSFSNLVELRVALWLRDRLSLQLIGKIVCRLRERGVERPLAEMRWAVVDTGRPKRPTDVIVQGGDAAWEEPVRGQIVVEGVLPLQRFEEEMRNAAERDRARRRQAGQLERRRGRLGSATVLAGTRVPADAVRRLWQAGWSEARILENYPGLTARDIRAVREAEAG